MKIRNYTTNLQYIMQYISIIILINSVIQDTQQIMTGQFDFSGTCPNDAETLPNLTADFSVITFQHDCILFGGRNMIKAKVIQQSGKVARVSVSRSLHPVNIRLCQFTFLLRRFSVRKISSLFFLIPSFGQRRVREDVFFPFFFFSFYEGAFCCSIRGFCYSIEGLRYNIRGFCNSIRKGGVYGFLIRQQTVVRRNMTAAAAFSDKKELPLNVGGSQDAVTFVERGIEETVLHKQTKHPADTIVIRAEELVGEFVIEVIIDMNNPRPNIDKTGYRAGS